MSLVLALAMVLSLATTAFGAATTTDEKAAVLYDLELFLGKSTTEYVPDLEGSTDRQQAMVMLSRAFAWAPVAGTLSGFPDVATWAEAEVAEAVAREITNGVGDGTTFGGTNTVSEREVATWIDRALGAELAGSWEANADLDSTTPLTRGDLIDMIWDALMETPIGGDETLIEAIVGTNDALIAIAVEGGLIEQARLIPEIKFDEDALIETPAGLALRADGASAVLVTFQLTDSITGLPAVTDREYEVAFSATFGTFGEQRVTAEDGTATVLLTSEFLTENVVSVLNATIIESAREEDEIIGIEVTENLIMSPNPAGLSDDSVGAAVTDAEANEADRIILYFDKDVDVEDYILDMADINADSDYDGLSTAAKEALDGTIDPDAAEIEVRTNATSSSTGVAVDVLTFAPLKDFDGNEVPNALQVILDVDDDLIKEDSLTDNSDVWYTFTDKTKALDVPSTGTFKNTDVRKPSMLKVKVVNLTTLQVSFSEAVLDIDPNSVQASAELLNNWQINGLLLSDNTWGVAAQDAASATVGTYVDHDRADNRHIVTIQLGEDMFGDQIYFAPGNYSIQAANIGDWAKLTDDKNVMNTQTLDFTIAEDVTVPVPTVTVMSPEQYLVEWNCEINESAADLAADMKVQKYNTSTAAWDDFGGSALLTAPDADGTLEFSIRELSTPTSNDAFIIETDLDWTVSYDTDANNKNYFNDLYRVFFKAGAAKNIANGKVNAETALQLTDQMYSPDTTSPTIVSIVENATTSTNYDVTFTEPVKESTLMNDSEDGATPDQERGGTTANAANWGLLPEPTYEFISDDYNFSVPGTAVGIDEKHMVVTVQPDIALKTKYVGGWTLVVRSISDDVGNTLPTDTEDFIVAGDATTATDFDIEWIFADIDFNLRVEDVDALEGPSTAWEGKQLDFDGAATHNDDPAYYTEDDTEEYDFVFIKFTKALATSGDFKNVLKTSNYTLDGQPLPTGTSIVANIKNYDDFDSVVDSVTIRLPQGYLEKVNSPHNINISKYLESAAGDVLGNKGGEKTLEYVNVGFGTWDDPTTVPVEQVAYPFGWTNSGNVPTLGGNPVIAHGQLSDDLTVAALVMDVRDAYNDAIVSVDFADLNTFETAYETADTAVANMNTLSSVKAQYRAYLSDTWLAIHNAIVAGDDFLLTEDIVNTSIAVEFGDDDQAVNAGLATATEYTFASTTVDTSAEVTAMGATGDLTVAAGATAGADEVTITVTDVFWKVSATAVVEITGAAITDISAGTDTASTSTTAP